MADGILWCIAKHVKLLVSGSEVSRVETELISCILSKEFKKMSHLGWSDSGEGHPIHELQAHYQTF